MPWESRSKVLTSLLGALLSTVAPLSRAIAETVGSVSAVNQSATGTEPGTGPRMLSLGANVVFNETIKTSAAGSAQLAFVDRSTLNVGRNSSVIIDQFVYDPASATGSMGLKLGSGVLRFVGGQISHTAGVTITTPVAVLGLRGGSATVGYASGKYCPGAIFINHIGALTLKNKVDQIHIDKPGYGVCVTSGDLPFPKPFLVPDWVLQAFLDSAGSGGGQHGGANDLPTDQMATRFGLDFPRLDPPGNPPGSNPFDIIGIINAGNGAAQGQAQNGQQGAYGFGN
jgi:hypothetical protein